MPISSCDFFTYSNNSTFRRNCWSSPSAFWAIAHSTELVDFHPLFFPPFHIVKGHLKICSLNTYEKELVLYFQIEKKCSDRRTTNKGSRTKGNRNISSATQCNDEDEKYSILPAGTCKSTIERRNMKKKEINERVQPRVSFTTPIFFFHFYLNA